MKEKTFDELFYDRIGNFDTEHHELIEKWEFIKFCKQVREATIAEAVNYCVSQDWIKTIDNLKRMPTDRIIDFELPTDRIKIKE